MISDARPHDSPLLRVVIVGDQPALFGMMKSAVEGLGGYRVVGGPGGEEDCRLEQPDLVIVDLSLPPGPGPGLVGGLRAACPGARILVFYACLPPSSVRAAFLSGAHGLVEKSAPPGEFERAVRAVGSGRVHLSAHASEVIRGIVRHGAGAWVRLTPRDREILAAIADGLSMKEIASRLGLNPHTAASRRKRLCDKTGLRRAAQLSRYAVQAGIAEWRVAGAAEPF